jgi:hypothetical protein
MPRLCAICSRRAGRLSRCGPAQCRRSSGRAGAAGELREGAEEAAEIIDKGLAKRVARLLDRF